jgi:hypothetical protein
MSCCGYHTLSWYYTYPSNPYKYVEVKSRPKATQRITQGILVEFQPGSTKESYTPSTPSPLRLSPPEVSSWYDLGMGWYNPPSTKR